MVDASALGARFSAPAMVDDPAPAPAAAPSPTPTPEPAPDNLVMASAAYVPSLALPLPEAAHSRRLEAGWLAPLSPDEASMTALRDRLVEALRGAGFGERWRLQPLPDGEGFMLVTAVEQAGGAGSRWVARDADPAGAGQRYRSFVFQVGGEDAGMPGRVLVYEAGTPHGNLAQFQADPSLTAVDHLKQAGILRANEVLVLATNP